MSTFNFENVERGKMGVADSLPEGTLRITKNHYSLSQDQVAHFQSSRYTSASGASKIRIAIAFDKYNQAIQLSASGAGFAGTITDSEALHGALPINFKRAGMLTGDYKAVDGQHGVYQLAR